MTNDHYRDEFYGAHTCDYCNHISDVDWLLIDDNQYETVCDSCGAANYATVDFFEEYDDDYYDFES